MIQKTVLTNTPDEASKIFGVYNCYAERIESAFGITLSCRDSETDAGMVIAVTGEDPDAVGKAYNAISSLQRIAKLNDDITDQNVDYVIAMVSDGRTDELSSYDDECICITTRGKPIKAKTVGQKKYIDAIKKNTVVLGVVPRVRVKRSLPLQWRRKRFGQKK